MLPKCAFAEHSADIKQQKIFLLQSLERDDSPYNTVVGSYMATRELVGKKRGGKKAMDAVAIVTYHLLAAGS